MLKLHGNKTLIAQEDFSFVGFNGERGIVINERERMKRFYLKMGDKVNVENLQERTQDDSSYTGGIWEFTYQNYLVETVYHEAFKIEE